MRAVVIVLVVVLVGWLVSGCGNADDAASSTTIVHAYETPKPNYPRAQDTPESFTTSTVRQRASRSSSRPRSVPAPSAAEDRSGTGQVDGDVWARLAMCESGMRQNAVSTNGLYLSYFQWTLPTWRSVGGIGDPRLVGYEMQVRLAQRLQERSGWSQWPRCSRRLGLR